MKTKLDFRGDAIDIMGCVLLDDGTYAITIKSHALKIEDEVIFPESVLSDWLDDNCPVESHPQFYSKQLVYECEEEYREGWAFEYPLDIIVDHLTAFEGRRLIQDNCSMESVSLYEWSEMSLAEQTDHFSGWVSQIQDIGLSDVPYWYAVLYIALMEGEPPYVSSDYMKDDEVESLQKFYEVCRKEFSYLL